MKRLSTLTLAVLAITLCACAHNSVIGFLDLGQGIPLYDKPDLEEAHAKLSAAVANGAGLKIRELDNCAVAFLNHPEYQSTPVTAPTSTQPAAPSAGPLSDGASKLIAIDAAARSIQRKRALIDAGAPDDIMIACSPLELTVGGALNSLNKVLHPSAIPILTPTKP